PARAEKSRRGCGTWNPQLCTARADSERRPDILPARMSRYAPTIAVIGGGFSGTALAAHLLRRGHPGRILLINRFGPMGRGVAYGTSLEAHVLTVPAGGMSALPEDRDHFVRWARTRDDLVRPDTFVSRRVYGEYLEAVLREAEHHTPRAARLERLVAGRRRGGGRPDGASAAGGFAGAPPAPPPPPPP